MQNGLCSRVIPPPADALRRGVDRGGCTGVATARCDAVVRSDDHGRIATFDYYVQGRDPSVVIGPHKPADEPDTAVDEPGSL